GIEAGRTERCEGDAHAPLGAHVLDLLAALTVAGDRAEARRTGDGAVLRQLRPAERKIAAEFAVEEADGAVADLGRIAGSDQGSRKRIERADKMRIGDLDPGRALARLRPVLVARDPAFRVSDGSDAVLLAGLVLGRKMLRLDAV